MAGDDRQEPEEADPMGYAYWGPDVGNEWTPNHPVRSGEMPDARNILRMSRAEFLRQFPPTPSDLAVQVIGLGEEDNSSSVAGSSSSQVGSDTQDIRQAGKED